MQIFLSFFKDFISIIYPPTCASCINTLELETDIVCPYCLEKLPKTNSHKRELPYLKEKFYGRIQLNELHAFLHYKKKSITQSLFYEFKYRGRNDVAIFLGNLFGQELTQTSLFSNKDCVLVPIPLHPTKQKQRGYNQSEEICKGLSESLQIPINTTSLLRSKAGDSQTRKNRIARWESLQSIFSLNDNSLAGLHVILVDDVLTTGATFEVCYNEVVKSSPKSISVLTLAIAPPK